MPTVTDTKTGETKEISMEEMMEALRNGNGSIQQVVTRPDGTSTSTTIYGNVNEDGLDRSVNIFVDKETFNAFITRKLKKLAGKMEDPESEKDPNDFYEMIIDFTESAMMGIVKKTKDILSVDVYTRDEQRATYDYLKNASKTWNVNEDGTIAFNGEDLKGEDKDICLYMFAFLEMRQFLRATGKLAELKALGNRGSGVIIKATDQGDDATATIVRGKNRPDLPCEVFLLGEQMVRPYMDEMMSDAMISGMSLEEKIEAAEAGDPDVMEELAQSYLNGDVDVQQDFKKSAYWWEKLAETGNTVGQFNTGLHYAKGCGVARDLKKAAEWMQKAADNGDEDAPTLVEEYGKADDNRKKAEAGDAQAQADLAAFLMKIGGSLDQFGPQEDFKESFKWAQLAAEQGNGDGMWALALCYEPGRGTAVDTGKAIEWYRKGMEIGHAPSQHSLGCYYMRGDQLQQDKKQAFDLFMKSAEQGYALALEAVGSCYQFGNGVDDDMGKAVEWYEKALKVKPNPELERKVEVFKMIENNGGFATDNPPESHLPEGYEEALQSFIDKEQANESTILATAIRTLNGEFDVDKEEAVLTLEVVGTQFEGRAQRIEKIRVGDVLHLVREPQNEKDAQNISVRNQNGESLGNLPANANRVLAPVIDQNLSKKITAKVCEVVPLSKRGSRAKKAILKLKITLDLAGAVCSTVCKLGGDQVNIWAQHLTVHYCTMPTAHLKLLFEAYNRYSREYEKLDKGENDTSYAGLDNLEEEIRAAREKMQADRVAGLDYSKGNVGDEIWCGTYFQMLMNSEPERYGVLKEYHLPSYANLQEIISEYTLAEKHYYWRDQTRVSQEEFDADFFNHWYDVMELYDGKELPVDLNDEDVVSIFGCGKFEAFADLSYGC